MGTSDEMEDSSSLAAVGGVGVGVSEGEEGEEELEESLDTVGTPTSSPRHGRDTHTRDKNSTTSTQVAEKQQVAKDAWG